MPSHQKHRGQHPKDRELFSDKWKQSFQKASYDLAYLWERGYSENSALKIVGDRYKLNARQRKALRRIGVATSAVYRRAQNCLDPSMLFGKTVAIDGFNLIIFTESALSGGIILACLDGVYRDIASVHGTYKRVEETPKALQLLASVFKQLGIEKVQWFLDMPVSNSGRLKVFMLEEAEKNKLDWTVELVYNPDKTLLELDKEVTIISSDGWILDQADQWTNLNAYLINNNISDASVFDCFEH